jgi:glycosyltransferase involved in cell wall biosynthesis
VLLSILIPTLNARRESFETLRAELMRQIGEREDVELLWASDDGELALGAKRNALVRRARGAYVCSIDDDDEVHPRYVELVTAALATRPDCVAITVEMRFRAGPVRRLELSARHRDYSSAGGIYRRPPHHLQPVRREIALRHPFPEVDRHEDQHWALAVAASGELRDEVVIGEVIYRYRSRRRYAWQHLLDRTERVRHALGLRMVRA